MYTSHRDKNNTSEGDKPVETVHSGLDLSLVNQMKGGEVVMSSKRLCTFLC